MDEPDVPEALSKIAQADDEFDLDEMTYYVGRQTPLPARRSGLMPWREKLPFLNANTGHPVNFFHIPPQQVVELGLEVEI